MAKRKRGGKWKWIIGGLLFLIGGGWGVLKYAEITATRDAEAQASKLRKLGYPMTVEEFIQKLPKDEAQNAAPIYLKAIEEYKRIGNPKETFTDSKGVLDPAARTKFVRETEGIYQLLVQASQKEHCVFPRDWSKGMDVIFPEFARMKTFARVCSARAEVAAEASDWRTALDSLAVGMRIAKHAEEPILIAHLVSVAIEAIQLRSFEGLVAQFSRNAQFLSEARAWVEHLPRVSDRKHAYDFELVASRTLFEQLADRSAENYMIDSVEGVDRFMITAMLRSPAARKRVEATYLRRMYDTLSQPADTPQQDVSRWDALDAQIAADTSMPGKVVSIVAPVFNQASYAFARIREQRRLAWVAVWVAEQQLQLGTMPHQLPTDERFIDTWTGERYVFEKRGEGFAVRSLGQNKVDDGGMMVSGKRTDDVDFMVPRER